jgi:pimeloyl-ACP methyl ester carboxylesterase
VNNDHPLPALLLLPGMPLDEALWDHQCRHLADIAAVTVADLTRSDSVEALARDALASAPPRFALAGLSMGGYVALEIMRQAPERVERLALLDTSARPDTPAQSANRRQAIDLAGQGRYGQVVATTLQRLIPPERLGETALTAAFTAQAQRVGVQAFVRQQTAIIGRPDSRPDLAAIACPTLVLCGRQDVVTPPEVHEEMAAGIPGARLVIVEDCGHLSAMERPQAVTALLQDWLLRP